MMNYQTTHEEVRAVRADRERVANLLGRYPQVSPQEAGEIVDFLRNGSHLDIGLLTSSEQLRPRLDAFMEDHEHHFRLKWREGAMLIGGLLVLLLTFILVWEAFS